ncbi:hypothetical protein CBM2598_U10027 [Cupriavidus taiwanensis]|nr:hypothetical protein CBM2598_U10027 [Cupriavidus taiwanensis]
MPRLLRMGHSDLSDRGIAGLSWQRNPERGIERRSSRWRAAAARAADAFSQSSKETMY